MSSSALEDMILSPPHCSHLCGVVLMRNTVRLKDRIGANILKVYRMTGVLMLPTAREALQPCAADGPPFVLRGGRSGGVGVCLIPTPVLA